MDRAIVMRLFALFDSSVTIEDILPMTINLLGNSSVATIPTLLDLLKKGKLKGHALKQGDVIVLASVGAGMNVNAVVYRM